MRRLKISFLKIDIVKAANKKTGTQCRDIKADLNQNKKCKIIYYFYGIKKSRLLLRLIKST